MMNILITFPIALTKQPYKKQLREGRVCILPQDLGLEILHQELENQLRSHY